MTITTEPIAYQLAGYTCVESIYQGTRTRVYRAVDEATEQSVVIKVLTQEYPSFSELVQFRNQYTVAKNLPIAGIIRPYSLEPCSNGYALVMEDIGGIDLGRYAQQYSLSLATILSMATQLAEILHELHQHRVIHKDIKPGNILVHPDCKQIKLIDFSIASLLPKETQTIQSPKSLEGTLAYLAPEQTGRMNRAIDYRADFYALGVTLYQLLTGQLPFTSNDPLEVIHGHMAQLPTAVNVIKSEVPSMVAAIVAKLMAKNAEDRYQSAHGLKHDLEKCLRHWNQQGEIINFDLGQRDNCDRFLIPEQLYGRKTEVATLLAAFEQVSQGSSELMLVAGFSGIGKTAVVNEVHKPITRQRGYFIKGKYDQFQRDIPLSAFVQAFQGLVELLLAESDDQLAQWKTKILTAVGNDAQVLIDVIPELERVIGTQPPAADLSGTAAQNRFNRLIQQFVSVFIKPNHPLVIFLDDLQWADLASLKLLQLLMQESAYLLIIGAYRDNEVSPTHPFILTVEELTKQQLKVNTMTLQTLSSNDLNQMIADTLQCDQDIAQPLTTLVYQKTQGNPFFTTQFLKALYEDNLIVFNAEIGYWQCDITAVRAVALTDDVVAFMAGRLQKLPAETRKILKLAACIGAQFDLQTLSIVCQQTPEQTATFLWPALQDGLIIPINETYKFYLQKSDRNGEIAQSSINSIYKFLHDRVQQSAYSLIPIDQRQATHLKIGQLLLAATGEADQNERLFEIANQLNAGRTLITDQAEHLKLAQLNLEAGLKAKGATAYTTARDYLQIGIQLCDRGWETNYQLTLTLYRQLAEIEFLCGNFEQTETYVNVVLNHAQDKLDQAEIYNLLVVQNTFIGQHNKAIEAGLMALKLLDFDLTKDDLQTAIQQEISIINTYLETHSVLSLLDDLSETDNPRIRTAVQLLVNIDPSLYVTSQIELYTLISAKIVTLSIEHGYIPETVKGYGNYGWLSGLVLGDYKTGYDFGVLGMDLAHKLHNRAQLSKVSLSFGSWIHGWSKPIREVFDINDEGYRAGIESGEVLFGGWNLFCKISNLLFAGISLDDIHKNLQKYLPFAHKTKNGFLYGVLGGIYLLVEPLRCATTVDTIPTSSDSHVDQESFIQFCENSQDFCSLSVFYTWQMQLACINQQFTKGLFYLKAAKRTLMGAIGFLPVSEYPVYASLILLNLYSEATPEQQLDYLNQVEEHQQQYKVWANNCAENFLHKYLLVEAERHRVMGNRLEAADCYDRAIAAAKVAEFVHIEALANELAAKFYLNWGRERIAQDYLIDAYHAYRRWGAKAKVVQLEQDYLNRLKRTSTAPLTTLNSLETLAAVSPNLIIQATGTLTSTRHTSSSNQLNQFLDFGAVLQASQVLSSTINLHKLLHELTHIILQNSGGDCCALILPDNAGNWQVRAITTAEETQLCTAPLTNNSNLPVKLIQYVKNTQETIVIDDLKTELPVIDDYLRQHEPKSVLCLPLFNQGHLTGILYLKNQLTSGVFTEDRLLVLSFLCAQAAISLENARLYQQAQYYAEQLEQSQLQLVQHEKMSTLGNLVAGVAHEVNNPISFLNGSVSNAKDYLQDLCNHLETYQSQQPPNERVQADAEEIDLDFLLTDFPKLLNSMQTAADRIIAISTSLRTFSRADTKAKVSVNIHEGLDSTLLILKYRLKANERRQTIEVLKHYGDLPEISCFPAQLNQVFMNILANAIDMFDEMAQQMDFDDLENSPQIITIKTVELAKQVEIRISDNGVGMTDEVKARIFDHLFTTKPVGKGTGLGLAIAHQIIVDTHGGSLNVHSKIGQGTEFRIQLPLESI